ncbi:hypothetical protein TNCV_3704551 [Trichonephila clavipes]|nr:hypothetical protein TNCV_3704551 [Trichonephila clavipes]
MSETRMPSTIALNACNLHMIFINSSTSTSFHLFSKTTKLIEPHLLVPISTNSTIPGNSPNTSVSSLSTETRLFLVTSDKFSTLLTEVQPTIPLLETSATTSYSEPSNISKIPKSLKQTFQKIEKSAQKNWNQKLK